MNGKRSLKKKAVATLAVIVALIAILGSTYAWRDYSQHKTNEASSLMPKYEVALVEDFQKKEDWNVSDGDVEKKISVKNTGSAAKGFEEVYVRIQLKEYMDMSPMVVEQTPNRYMVNADGAYIVFNTEADAMATYPDAPGYAELTDAVSGKTGWFVRTRDGDDHGQYGKYVTTKYEEGAKTWIAGDHTMENARNDAADPGKHDVMPNGECAYPVRLHDGTINPAEQYVAWSLNGGTSALGSPFVIKLSQWDGSCGPFWIIDDTQGNNAPWIYWGEALLPNAETADFLESIKLVKQPDGNFYYAIHTELEAVSLEELFGGGAQWVDMPGDIRSAWQQDVPEITLDFGAMQSPFTIKCGEVLSAPVVSVKPASLSQTVTFKSGNPAVATVDASGNVTGVTEGETLITVAADNGKKVTYKVIVKGTATTKYEELQALLDEVSKLKPADYTPSTWQDLCDAVLLADPITPATDDPTIQGVIDAITGAKNALVNAAPSVVDKSVLLRLLGVGNALDEDDYTVSSWNVFEPALDTGNTVYNDPNATQSEIDQAAEALKTAMYGVDEILNNGDGGLVARGDTTVLDALVNTALGKTPASNYTQDTYNALQQALNAAGGAAPVDNSDLDQAEVDILADGLRAALANLVELTGLLDAIAEAVSKNMLDYDPASWQNLLAALTAADSVKDPAANASQTDVDNAEQAIRSAIAGLIPVSDKAALTAALSGHPKSEADYTVSSWTASDYSNKYHAANNLLIRLDDGDSLNDPSPSEIKTAIDELTAADSALVRRGDPAAINVLATASQNNLNEPSWAAGYSTDSKDKLQNAVHAAGDGNLDVADLSQPQVDVLYADLLAAAAPYSLATGEGMVDVSVLLAAIAAKVLLDPNESDYTTGSWSDLENAYAEALTALSNANNGVGMDIQTNVNTKAGDLRDAIAALQLASAGPVAPIVADAANYVLAPAKTGDTVPWRGIATAKVGGDDYILVVRSSVIGKTFYSTYGYPDYADSLVVTMVDNWYRNFANAHSSSPLVASASTNILPREAVAFEHDQDGYSTPTGMVAARGAAGTAFILSADEYMDYLSKRYNSMSSGMLYNTSNTQSGGSKLTPYKNWETLQDRDSVYDWTRTLASDTPGQEVMYFVEEGTVSSGSGAWYYNYSGYGVQMSVRPAIWVKANAFN